MQMFVIASKSGYNKEKGGDIMANTSAVGVMTREELDAELQKGVDSIKAGKVYSADEVDAALAKEFGI